jgi:hypothetical protein
VNVNSANYQNPLIGFDLPSYVGTQPAVARIYFARIQRAPEGSDHSTTQGRHNIIERRRVRFRQFCGIQAIMLGNGSMNAEDDWLRLPGQVRYSKRPRPPFNPNVGHVHWIRHFVLSFLHEGSIKDAAYAPDVTFLRQILPVLFDDLSEETGKRIYKAIPGLHTGPDPRIWADSINI